MRVKKIPIDSTWAEFWKVEFIPPPTPRSAGRQAVHDGGAVGGGEGAHGQAVEQKYQRELPVGEVDREQQHQEEGDGGAEHPAGGERAGAETVREDIRIGVRRSGTRAVSGIM